MATIHQLPVKRPNEEIGSGSDSGSDSDSDSDSDSESKEKASKKAQVVLSSDIPEFTTYSEFAEFCGNRTDEFVLDRYQEQMTRRCKLQEIRYYLTSKGQADRAVSIQSEKDLDEEELKEFKAKQWHLNARVGPYDDYQRLVVLHDCWDNLYRNTFRSYDCDIAYQKFFEELKEAVELASSSSNAASIGQSISVNYVKLDSASVHHAIRETIDWWRLEEYKKDRIPILSKICHEVLTKERGIEEVVNETVRQVVGPCTRGESYILSDIEDGGDFTRHVINQVKRYIAENKEENFVDEIHIECLVKRCMEKDPHYLVYIFKYVDYIKMKLSVAKHLGII